MAIRCPFCGNELTGPEAAAKILYCNRLQFTNGSLPKYEHSPEKALESNDERIVAWSEGVSDRYRRVSAQNRTRFVSLVGPSTSGKTVWLLSVGAHVQCPTPVDNWLRHTLSGHLMTIEAAQQDRRKAAIERLPLGALPLRTERFRQAMTLPLALSRGSIDDEGRCLVLKDVGGETTEMADLSRLLNEPDTRHLLHSDWLVIVLDARDEWELGRSAGRIAASFLPQYEDFTSGLVPPWYKRLFGGSRRRAGVVVLLTCIDDRLSDRDDPLSNRDDPLLKAALTLPNRFHGEPVDMGKYFAQMEHVQQEARATLERTEGARGLPDRLAKTFGAKQVFYAATSALGMEPVAPAHRIGVTYEGQCITEPAMIRVMDPLLWILRAEGAL